MNVVGKKVILRELRENDMELLNSLINNDKISYNTIGWSKPITMSEQLNWFKNLENDSSIRYAIVDLNDSLVFGTAIINKIDWKNKNCSIDIKLDIKYHNKGYGSESIMLLVKNAFDELNMNSINAKVLCYNIASQKVFEKNGFVKSGILREHVFKNGKYNDVLIYVLLKKDYKYGRNWE